MNDATWAEADVKLHSKERKGKENELFSDYTVKARAEASVVNLKSLSYFSMYCTASFVLFVWNT